MAGFFVTGTDTDVGKTVAAAWVTLQLDGCYWKPVQSGLSEGRTDTEVVHALTGFAPARFLKSRYSLTEPLSPHEAARLDGVTIKLEDFWLPQIERPLIIEGAGGVLVPLNGEETMRDLMRHLGLPLIVVARSSLGTINHTLLTLEALRARDLPIAGVILNGVPNAANQAAIEKFGKVRILAALPRFSPLSTAALAETMPLIPPQDWTLI